MMQKLKCVMLGTLEFGESCCTCSAKPECKGSERYLQGRLLRLQSFEAL